MAKTSRKMGFSFFPKTRARGRLKKLANEADKLGKKMCKLTDDVEREKSVASNIFTKSEFEREAADVDKHLEEACDCGPGGGAAGGEGGGSDAEKKARKNCREKLKIKSSGAIPDDKKADWEDCVKKSGGVV